jgi:ribonuclease HII
VEDKFGIRVCLFSKLSMKVNSSVSRSNPLVGEEDSITLISEHKADARYPVVSGASIIAKVIRDGEMDGISDAVGIDLGSGYPSDAKTVNAIKDNLGDKKLGGYVRDRWKTMEIIRQSKIDEFI